MAYFCSKSRTLKKAIHPPPKEVGICHEHFTSFLSSIYICLRKCSISGCIYALAVNLGFECPSSLDMDVRSTRFSTNLVAKVCLHL